MKKKTKYKNAPVNIGESIYESVRIKDFLPPPEELIIKEEIVKVTLNLNKESVNFFKETAKKTGMPYQKMIKKVLDLYANIYKK